MSFLRCIVDMTFNLSKTVGRVELPIAATSGFHASLSNKSKALLCPRSTNAPFNSVVKSDTVSWYNCLKGGTIRPMFYLSEEVEDIMRIVLLGPGEGSESTIRYLPRPPAYWPLIYYLGVVATSKD